MRELDDVTGAIVDASVRIHRDLGPGLFESVYEAILARALEERGLRVERQLPMRLEYEGVVFEEAFRVDLLVDSRVIVEIKSIEKLAPVHTKQLLTYLRIADLRAGLLVNFGSLLLRDGLRRVVNNLTPAVSPRLRVNRRAPSGRGATELPIEPPNRRTPPAPPPR